MDLKALTNEQLVIRIKAGLDVAENCAALWEKNQGLIQKIIKPYQRGTDNEDIRQEAYLGLYDAIQHYDPDKGVKFMSYAPYWIINQVQEYLRRSNPQHISSWVNEYRFKYNRLVDNFCKERGRVPTDRETCYYLDISGSQLDSIKRCIMSGSVKSLDEPIGTGDKDKIPLCETVSGSYNVENDVIEEIKKKNLKQLYGALWMICRICKETSSGQDTKTAVH